MPSANLAGLASGLASFVLPGVGQALRGRLADAALFAITALYLHAAFAAHAQGADRIAGLCFGAPAIQGGLRTPVLVVLTVCALLLHLWAARDAWGGRR